MNATTAEGAIVYLLTQDVFGLGQIVGTRISTATGASKNARPKMYYERIGTTKAYCNDGALGLHNLAFTSMRPQTTY